MFSLKKLIIIFLAFLVLIYLYLIYNKQENFAIQENNILSLRSHIDCSNKNKNVSQQDFPLKKIIHNELSNSDIEYIMDASFILFRNLEEINLVDKKIKVLHKHTFMNNKNLKYLNLADTKINTIVSDMFKDNMNIKLSNINEDQTVEQTQSAGGTTSASERYGVHFHNNFTDDTYTQNKINLILTKETLYRLNILKTLDNYSFMRNFEHLPYDAIDDNSVNIYNFIKYINGIVSSENGTGISVDVFNMFVKIALGITHSNLDKFNMTIGDNDGSTQKYPVNIVYYKDIIYHTDCGHWRKQFMNLDQISSDFVLNILCLRETINKRVVYTHILELFKSLHENLYGLSLIYSGLTAYLSGSSTNFSDGQDTANELLEEIKGIRSKLTQAGNSIKDNNQYKNLFIEFYSERFGRDCLPIESVGSSSTSDSIKVDEVNYQCNDLVTQILANSRSQLQTSDSPIVESVPENKSNFCSMISNYETCNDLDQCETYVSSNNRSNFVCKDVCENKDSNTCEIFNNCIFRNNNCFSRSIMNLTDDQLQQYHNEATYPSNVTFPATPTQEAIVYPTGPAPTIKYPDGSEPAFSYASEDDIPVYPTFEPFVSGSDNKKMIVTLGGNNYVINYCGDTEYTSHSFYDLYHLEEIERFHRLGLILKNIFKYDNGIGRYEELQAESNLFLINYSKSMIKTINNAN